MPWAPVCCVLFHHFCPSKRQRLLANAWLAKTANDVHSVPETLTLTTWFQAEGGSEKLQKDMSKLGQGETSAKVKTIMSKKLSGATPRKFVVLASCLVYETFVLGPSTSFRVEDDAVAAELMAGCSSRTREEHSFSALGLQT